jgi:HK97 gp10 family phage protein
VNDLVHVKGLSDLQRFLDTLPAKMEQNVLRSALRQGANVIMAEAKQRVSVVSGKLRDSIRVSVSARRGKVTASVRAGSRSSKKTVREKRGGGVAVDYNDPFYAPWVEYGTAAHFIGVKYAKALVLRPNVRASSGFAKRLMRAGVLVEGVHHPGARPRPFLRPAMDTKAQEALVAVGNAIKARLAVKHGLDTSGVEVSA